MEQPPDFEVSDRMKYVLRLQKALYGLKQGGRKWYETLRTALADLGLSRAESDFSVFFAHIENQIVIILVHVDDCAITGSSQELVNEFKTKIGAKYKLTDFGPISWFLGIKVIRDREARTISLSQTSYINSILTRFNFDDLRPLSTPMDPTLTLSKTQSPTSIRDIIEMKKIPYREAIGSLMWASMGTRPDITFAVALLSQFSENPGAIHWEATKHVFRYLAGTREWGLTYGSERNGLIGFTDADGASQEHRHAISGSVYLIDGGAVSWSSKKQELVTLSTTEAEYVAATHAAKEGIWLRRFISEVFRPLVHPTTLYCDNQSAIALSKDGQYHARTKHIDIRYHFIRYVVEDGTMKLIYCPTNDMTADTLTKPLPSIKAKHFAASLGLRAV
jgi:hypothetical protein